MSTELDLGWEDVLRRARRRRPRRRLLAATVVVAAALGGAPALAVLLTGAPQPRLPKAADRSNVAVILQPRTGRVVVEVAPWKGHDGICYLLGGYTDGCSMWSRHGAMFNGGWASGYTFDERVASVDATLRGGKTLHLTLHRFAHLRVTFFVGPRTRDPVVGYTLRNESGHAIARVRLGGKHP